MSQDQAEPLSPRMRGVFTAETFLELLPQHKKITARVVSEVIVLAKAEVAIEDRIRSNVRGEAQKSQAYQANVLGRQPHQSFLIDGPKGAGKTTLLLNLRCALAQIGPSAESRHVAGTFEVGDLEAYWPSLRGQKLAAFQQLKIEGNARFLVHALPVVRPDSMETHESIMECVLAEMTHELDQLTGLGEDRPAYPDAAFADTSRPLSQAMERKIERARKLKQQLQTHVAKGWYFAKQLGLEALVNDSMNFDEYIERRASEAVVSHRRNWMSYVIDYLDLFDSEMLAIFIDDTDISAELAADILHTIRMFFAHLRIVVIMAGNLHSVRQRLLVRAMSLQAESHKSLRAPDSLTARFWRDFDRENIEEYLARIATSSHRRRPTASSSCCATASWTSAPRRCACASAPICASGAPRCSAARRTRGCARRHRAPRRAPDPLSHSSPPRRRPRCLQHCLLDEIRNRQITIETNPSSNMRMERIASPSALPVWNMLRNRSNPPAVTICTDNPGTYDINIETEYAVMHAALLASLGDEKRDEALSMLETMRAAGHRLFAAFSPTSRQDGCAD